MLLNQRPAISRCPPPKGFEPAGTVLYAVPAITAPNFASGLNRGKGSLQRKGVKYERQGQEYLSERYPGRHVAGPWFRFVSHHDSARMRWCQPDALLFDFQAGVITLVEFKWKHTSNAWWQTRKLYEPVLRKQFPEKFWSIRICEVCRWFDASTVFPEGYKLVGAPEQIGLGGFGVLVWAPGREFR